LNFIDRFSKKIMNIKFHENPFSGSRVISCRQAGRQAGRRAGRRAGRQAGGQAGRQAGRQAAIRKLRVAFRKFANVLKISRFFSYSYLLRLFRQVPFKPGLLQIAG
jgi:predicted transposase YdaD